VTDANGCSSCSSVHISYPTEVKELSVSGIFSIYPNPAHDKFTVSLSEQWTIDNGQLEIYDIVGQEVYRQKIHSSLLTINCSLSPGVYLVKVSCSERVVTKKVIIE
jgi:hypothetical protein